MDTQEGKIIDEICEYVEAKHIKETFQEYLKRYSRAHSTLYYRIVCD